MGRLGSVAVVCGNGVLASVGVALGGGGGGGAVVVVSTDDGVEVDVEVDVVWGTEVERGDVVVVVLVPAAVVDVDNVDRVV